MNKHESIYVAGHRGLVGSAITRRLNELGFSNIITRTHSELDLIDQKAVATFFSKEKPSRVYLAAAKVGGIMANDTYRAEFIYQNLMIQSNIIHQSMLNGVKRLTFFGSSCIYPRTAPQPLKEDYLMTGSLEPTNSPYAVAKIAGIEMCAAYNQQYGTSFIPVMPTNLYGPGDNFDLEKSHVLPALIRKFHLGKLAMADNWEGIEADERLWGPIPNELKQSIGYTTRNASDCTVILWGSGAPSREFMHVEDMVDASIHISQSTKSNELTNIGTGLEVTIKEAAEMIAEIVKYKGKIVWDTTKPDGAPRKVLDGSKLKTLEWKSKISLHEGLVRTYAEYTQHNVV